MKGIIKMNVVREKSSVYGEWRGGSLNDAFGGLGLDFATRRALLDLCETELEYLG